MRSLGWVGLALLLASLTHQQTATRWQSDEALWCGAVRFTPEKPRPLNNCALALLRRGDYEAALPLLDRGLVVVESREPNRRTALRMALTANRFLVLYALRDLTAARRDLARMDPDDPRTQTFTTWIAGSPFSF